MKKHDVFTFTAPNGVEVTGIVLGRLEATNGPFINTLICYAQNRIFTYKEEEYAGWSTKWKSELRYKYGETLVDYAVLPEYDDYLSNYFDAQIAQTETNLESNVQFQ